MHQIEARQDKKDRPGNNNESSKMTLPFVFLFGVLITADQVTKNLIDQPFRNYNFAFSLPVPVWLMYGLYLFFISVMLGYVYRHFKTFSRAQTLAWLLIFAGAASNIIERIALGYVRDWVYVFNGVLNLADFYIILGIAILLLNPKSEYRNSKQIPNSKV